MKQDKELVLLMNKTSENSEGSGEACMMVVQTGDLSFISISRSSSLDQWELDDLKVMLILTTHRHFVKTIPFPAPHVNVIVRTYPS